MAGRFRDEDIAAVREKIRIDEVIGEHIQLRNAGGGNMMGICPFHDEKSPSLSVSPSRGLYHCFGCGAGGDVITFVQEIDHLSFGEAVENLAARAGIQLRYTEGGAPSRPSGQRARLVEAHTLAAAFYSEALRTPEAQPAREFLAQRGFDEAAAAQFGCGYAPSGWDSLTKYLQARGFTAQELTLGGLAKESGRGSLIDRFHRRLVWPIKDVGGDVVGFGARRIHDDDRIEAKYLNSPETPIYKKNQLLYGVDLAKREIGRQHKVVVVEGYTDVMACHLAGVGTAVASCGTAFGSEHVGVLRRLLGDSDTFGAEVIFTFDGDAAGMKAAERAFAEDQRFMAQTKVAIAPEGKDPCELRISSGDAAVRALVDGARPLVEFVLRTIANRHDLDTVEGRTAALDRCIPLVARIKDFGARDDYARQLAGYVGVDDPNRIVARVRALVRAGERGGAASGSSGHTPNSSASNAAGAGAAPPSEPATEAVHPKIAQAEREVIKAALQLPDVVGKAFDELPASAFLVAVHQQLAGAIAAAGGAGPATTGPGWVEQVAAQLIEGSQARSAVNALAVEPLRSGADSQARYAEAMVVSLAAQSAAREVSVLKSRLQRADPADVEEQGRLFAQLMEAEKRRQELRRRAIGGED